MSKSVINVYLPIKKMPENIVLVVVLDKSFNLGVGVGGSG